MLVKQKRFTWGFFLIKATAQFGVSGSCIKLEKDLPTEKILKIYLLLGFLHFSNNSELTKKG